MSWKVLGLTGRIRVRANWWGKLIVQVEYQKQFNDCSYAASCGAAHPEDGKVFAGFWRDAKVSDIKISKEKMP